MTNVKFINIYIFSCFISNTMTHINYFEPYESKQPYHEDQLTRAFFVVLRYVPSTLLMFYDYVVSTINKKASENGRNIDIPSVSQLDLSNLDFEIQTQKVDKEYKTNKIISVLITDKTFESKKDVSKSERGARYDGIVYFSSDIALIVENKPQSYNVWEAQLSPSAKSLPEGVEIIPIASIIEWKEIIKSLNGLIKGNLLSRAEKEVIGDFLDFIDDKFPRLNPYDNFADCKNNPELLDRRVKNLLEKSVAKSEDFVHYHTGWKCYYLDTRLPEIWLVGLKIKQKGKDDWELNIEMYFGDTTSQARELYKNKINYREITSLEEKGWKYSPHFHISFIRKNLVWLDTPTESKKKYISHWSSELFDDIKSYSKSELNSLLNKLLKEKLVQITSEDESHIKEQITDTHRKNFYICPAFALIYSFNSDKVKELDSKKELADEIKSKIREGISILGKETDFLK